MDGSRCLRPLGPGARAAIERLISGGPAWVGVRRIKEAVLAELTAGPHPWCEVGGLPRRDVVTLTPLAAEVLGVELVGPEDEMAWHWEPIDEDRPQPNELTKGGPIRLNHPDFIADPRPTSLEYLIDLETGRQTDDEGEAMTVMGALVRVDKRAARRRFAEREEGRRRAVRHGGAAYARGRRGAALLPGNCPEA